VLSELQPILETKHSFIYWQLLSQGSIIQGERSDVFPRQL
jgi:hypothetical protein